MFAYWWKCAKIAARGSAAFANDWQWLFGYPAVAVGIYLFSKLISGGIMQFLSANTAQGALAVAALAFFVTWVVGFMFRLVSVPAQIEAERATQIAALEARLGHKANLEFRFDSDANAVRSGMNSQWSLGIYNAGPAVAQNVVLRLIMSR